MEWSRVAPAGCDRTARAQRLFGLLGQAPKISERRRDVLVDLTMARVLRTPRSVTPPQRQAEPALTLEDEEALEALALSGMKPAQVASSLRARAEKINGLLRLLETAPVTGKEFRIESTLDRIRREPAPRQRRAEFSGGGLAFPKWRDLVSVAAVLLLGASVVWPMAATWRQHAERTACASNLSTVAAAMGSYGNDYRNSLPVAAAGFTGPAWWDVGKGVSRSNSANLFLLPRKGYAALASLACGGNPNAERGPIAKDATDWADLKSVSYSYHIMSGPRLPAWRDEACRVVLADRSPVVLRAVRGEVIFPFENSPNHQGRGQTVLRNDGSAEWLVTPVDGDDNLWLPSQIENIPAIKAAQRALRAQPLKGNETPTCERDVLLGP